MDLTASSSKPELSPSGSVGDPEEKEISDEDDDDRNHKHRRRETQSQSLERDPLEQVLTRPYRKRNKPFENGHIYSDSNSHSNDNWRNYNISPLEKDLSGKFDKRRPGLAPVSRAPFDLNHRIKLNQPLSGHPGSGRGRGREAGSWSQRDSRFGSVNITSEMVQLGSVRPNLFAGMGIPAVSNAQSASWNAYGLSPGLPNGGLDTFHPLGIQPTLRAPINPSMNMGIPCQRCRDFEERGFCLRGDMCPMEHGVNRIVVEDVQSLSQFNLPVSLPSAHLLGAPAGPGPLSAISAPSSSLVNSKGLYSKNSKSAASDDGLGNGAFIGSAVATAADFYDPDQPLWTNDSSQTSTGLLTLNASNVDETGSLLGADPPGDQNVGLYDGSDNERSVRSTGVAVTSQTASLSVWGRISSSKNKPEMREKLDSTISSSNNAGITAKEDQELLINAQGAIDLSMKTLNNIGRTIRKPSQKAQRTLFVNGIPQKNNRKEVLLSHFRKFGQIIDIYIPLNSERAFIQFSKREEAEDALRAPDAVMGNRFIKLWWANRDSIPDGITTGNSALIASRSVTVDSVPGGPTVANRGNDTPLSAALKGGSVHTSATSMPASEHPKPVVANGPFPPAQKQLETLEFLKELRKKQEMLDQKRNDFRLKLNKLEKQATGLKSEVASEQATKKHKVGTVSYAAKAATPSSFTAVAPPLPELMADRSRSGENSVPQISKTNDMVALQEPSSLKQSIRPLAPAGAPLVMNRFKLDNRPTSFKIISPLPTALANFAALKEHFSAYGELSSVNLEDLEFQDGGDELDTSRSSARISFTTRQSAERAFLNGKCWKGHNMQFMWLTSSKDNSVRENPSSSSKGSSDANGQPAGEVASTVSQKEAMSGDGESEVSERRDIGPESMVPEEEFQSSMTTISYEKQSPQHHTS